jgi:hypothetical protein
VLRITILNAETPCANDVLEIHDNTLTIGLGANSVDAGTTIANDVPDTLEDTLQVGLDPFVRQVEEHAEVHIPHTKGNQFVNIDFRASEHEFLGVLVEHRESLPEHTERLAYNLYSVGIAIFTYHLHHILDTGDGDREKTNVCWHFGHVETKRYKGVGVVLYSSEINELFNQLVISIFSIHFYKKLRYEIH